LSGHEARLFARLRQCVNLLNQERNVPSGELDDLLGRIEEKYQVSTVPLQIGDKKLRVLQLDNFVETIERIVERDSLDFHDLPYWAKVWEASFVLAYFLGRQPVVLGRRLLEIGAGLGIVGIYAALCGHQVTITDNNPDALLFARANALLNGCPGVEVRSLDWAAPDSGERYDMIFGSEVVYERETYPILVQFLDRTLAPGGHVFLAKNSDLSTPKFFVELAKRFSFKQKEVPLQGGEDGESTILYAIRRKEHL
jgi:predicted nicotinamide N-methyase